MNCTINETKIDWASLAESADVLPYDVMLTPGDPTCFGNDPDLLMSWWYGDNVWTQGRSCWKKAGDGKFDELQTLMQQAREATGNEQPGAVEQVLRPSGRGSSAVPAVPPRAGHGLPGDADHRLRAHRHDGPRVPRCEREGVSARCEPVEQGNPQGSLRKERALAFEKEAL